MGLRRALAQPARYLALAAGALPVLAFPAANLEWLAWFGLVPGLALMQRAPGAREAAVRAAWFGAGFLLAGLYWLAPNIGPGLLLVAAVFGLLWAGVGAAVRLLLAPPVTPGRALAALAVVPSCWLTVEWIRSWQALGGPWNVLGASQWQHPAVLALAAVGGVWLVSFALVACNTGLLIALTPGRAAARLAGAAGAAAAIAAGPVAFALTPAAPPAGRVTIALVQPGSPPGPAARLAEGERLTRAVAHRAGLIVWGESSVGYDIAARPQLLARLRRLSAAAGAQLLVSQDAITPAGAHAKDAVLIGPGGIAGIYVKSRLVPFGEYIPLRSVLGWLTAISRAAPQNMVPGPGARVLHATLPGGRPLAIGVLICFESAFPDMSRADTDHGARVIIYQTSDSTFQHSWALAQHASLGAVRAAETGRPVVQAALTGDSAAFDDRGRLLRWIGGGQRGTATVTLSFPAASARTPFDRLGDYVPWSAVGIAAAAALAGLAARRSRRPPGGRPRIGWQGRRLPGRPAVPQSEPTARASGPRARRWLAAAAACTAAALLAACSGSGPASAGHGGSGGHQAAGTGSGPRLTITPASGSDRAATAAGITVTAAGGTISSVRVTAPGGPVPGTLNAARTSWHSDWALAVSRRYTVTARAVAPSGAAATKVSSFRTLTPASTDTTEIFEGYRQTYGVGMPIMLTFSRPVVNKAAVERSLQLRTSKPVTGAWYWDGDQALDFRTRGYWPAHTQVSFTGHLDGVEFAPGVYGSYELTQTFEIGRSLIVVASTRTHHMRLYRAGKLIDRWPISTGRVGDYTPDGTYVTIDKGNPVDMKGPGYNIEVPWSVRFTWTGDYLHDAYWSVSEQGFTNVSHGCVNMAPADAQDYYQMEVPGDPVTITGSPRAGSWDNGWTEWFLSFDKLVQGSALHMAVQAGPDGSKFVSPSSLPAAAAQAPLAGPAPGNAAAA